MHKIAGDIAGSEALFSSSSPEAQGVLFDDQVLTREQAIARYLKPLEGYENVEPTREKKVKEGKNFMLWLNPTTPFIAPQIRDAYRPEHLETIGRSIAENPHGQLQNCAVALNDEAHVQRFLDHLNEYFGSEITIADLEDHRIGDYYVTTIFGHNRQLGIASVNLKTSGHPDKGLRMRATGFVNPPFWQVISDQATENTGQNPNMWDRARSIVMYKNLRIRDGNPPTQDEMAKIFGVHPDQIWRAERYDALPSEIKSLVMNGLMTFSGAIEFHLLNNLYGQEDIVLLAKSLASRKASGPQIMEEIRKRLLVGNLTPEIRYLVEEGSVTLPQAQALNKLSRFLTPDKLNEFAAWISLAKPSTKQVEERVRNEITRLQSGQLSAFDNNDEAAMDVAQAGIAEYVSNQQAALIQRAITSVSQHVNSIRTAVGAGLVGDIIDGNPIAYNAKYQLIDELLGTLDNVRTAEAEGLSRGLREIRSALGSSANGLGSQVLKGLEELAELIELENAHTAETQAQVREELLRKFGTASTQSVVQGGLF